MSQEESLEMTQVEVLCLQAPEATDVFVGSPAAAVHAEAPLKFHQKDKKDGQGSVPSQHCQSGAQERSFRGSEWPETMQRI